MEKMGKVKVVVDTNIFISALINPNGTPGKILDLIFEEKIVNYTSISILKEIGFKCLSPKLRKYLGNEKRVLKILSAFSSVSIIINPKFNFNICRDEDDNKFKLEYQRFVFKIFLMYDVIYYKDEAVFTRFDLNRGLFNSIKKRILDSYNKDIPFRDYGKDLIIRLLETTLDYYHCEYKEDVYKSIIDYYKKKKIVLFEPLSYYLIFKIWKYAKLIQSTLEFLDKKELDKEKEEFKHYMDKFYIQKGINIIDDFYNAKITNNTLFYKFYEIDKDIFDSYILNHVLPAYSNSIDIKFPDYESKYLLFSAFISGC